MRTSGQIAAMLLATVLAAGFVLLWCLAVICSSETFHRGSQVPQIVISPEGAPLVRYQTEKLTRYEDLRGLPVETTPGDELILCYLPAKEDWRPFGSWLFPRKQSWSSRIASFSSKSSFPTYWYLIQDGRPEGAAYFEGYEAVSGRRVGYLGSSGFLAEQPAEDDCFSLPDGFQRTFNAAGIYAGATSIPRSTWTTSCQGFDPSAVFLIAEDHRFYEVDLKSRSVRPLLADSQVLSYWISQPNHTGSASLGKLAVRTKQDVLLLAGPDEIERRYKIPAELQADDFNWTEISPDSAVSIVEIITADQQSPRIAHLRWWSRSGDVSRREDVTLPSYRGFEPPMALAFPMPLIQTVFVGLVVPDVLIAQGRAASWREGVQIAAHEFCAHTPSATGLSLLTLAISLLLAIACYRRQARYGASRRECIAWTTFVFLLGLPGWIGYRFSRRWPALEECPACHRAIPRNDMHCPRCHAELPRPAPLGIEILAGSA